MKWEYKVVIKNWPARDTVYVLNEMGQQGWELCGVYEPRGLTNEEFILKRRVE